MDQVCILLKLINEIDFMIQTWEAKINESDIYLKSLNKENLHDFIFPSDVTGLNENNINSDKKEAENMVRKLKEQKANLIAALNI